MQDNLSAASAALEAEKARAHQASEESSAQHADDISALRQTMSEVQSSATEALDSEKERAQLELDEVSTKHAAAIAALEFAMNEAQSSAAICL